MKVPAGQTVEECIRDDVHDLMVKTVRVPKLAYMVNPVDASAMLARLPRVGGSQIDDGKPTWFEMHTEAGYVRIVVDPNHPTGATHRFVICKCGALSLYMPGVEQCLNCLMLKPRPYAPGEKLTDRHPDSVIAKVVEGTIEKHNLDRAKFLATPIKVRSPYAPLPPVGEPAFRLFEREEALWVDTPSGPVKLTADPTVPPGEVRFVQPETVPPELLAHQDRLARATHEAMGMPADVFRGVDRSATPEKLSGAVLAAQRGPFDYEVPSYDGILKAPYEQPARPDGFDQRQVDAAKAALLAPAPPRYPRTR